MAIRYEWDVEVVLKYAGTDEEDILDHNHADRVVDLLPILTGPRPDPAGVLTTRLVLIRDTLDAWADAVEDRAWAYVEDGRLPDTFDDGHPVPKRYHDELARAIAR